jgi:AraC-like DNA-binding protein
MRRAVFDSAKIVHVMDGAARVETALGTYELSPGSVLVLGAGKWCSLMPERAVRVWTIYVDEEFLRAQMGWTLPVRSRIIPGMHPLDWSGAPLVLKPGPDALRRVEPIWRRMSVLSNSQLPPEKAAARAVALFAWAVELSVEALVVPGPAAVESPWQSPVMGSLSSSSAGQVGRAARALRTRMTEAWSVERLAGEVALSRTHLTRLFSVEFGIAPIRFLTEVRLTEFTRLIEETDLTVDAAARAVGWTDSRVAAIWFRRRFGVSPSQFRRRPHPFIENSAG